MVILKLELGYNFQKLKKSAYFQKSDITHLLFLFPCVGVALCSPDLNI